MEQFFKDYASTIAFLSAVASASSAILTLLYVRLTRLTFVEIKKQTDHATLPRLIAKKKVHDLDKSDAQDMCSSAVELSNKWEGIIRAANSNAVTESKPLGIVVRNVGHSDAVSCKLTVWGCITPKGSLIKLNTNKEEFRYEFDFDNIQPGMDVIVPFGFYGNFPSICYNVRICYQSISGGEYDEALFDVFSNENKLV